MPFETSDWAGLFNRCSLQSMASSRQHQFPLSLLICVTEQLLAVL